MRLQVQQQRKRTLGSQGTLALASFLWRVSLVGRDAEDRRVENVDLEGKIRNPSLGVIVLAVKK